MIIKPEKTSALLLALLILTAMFSACGSAAGQDAGGTAPQDAAPDTASAETEADTGDGFIHDDLGDLDFSGKTFDILYAAGFFFSPYDPESENGEVLNDAAYQRNRDVEERFGASIAYHVLEGSYTEPGEALKKSVMAGDSDYDLVIVHPFGGLTGLISGGIVGDWNALDNIDLSKPYWNASFNRNLAIGPLLPCSSSDFIYFNAGCIYFNREIQESIGLDSPYLSVRDGSWTWEKLRGAAASAYTDLNGNGSEDTDDRFGFTVVLNHRMIPNTYSCGIMSTSFSQDGSPSFENIASEKMQSVVDMFYKLLYESSGVHAFKSGEDELSIFRGGRSLFTEYVTQNIAVLRDLEFDYGMLPLPKYDEAQKDYVTLAQSNVMVYPSNAEDLSFTGAMIEALSCESYNKVMPALYETTFENKYLRDDDSYAMFNIIKSSLTYDILWNYTEGSDLCYFFNKLMEKGSADLASFYSKYGEKTQKTLTDFFEAARSAFGA